MTAHSQQTAWKASLELGFSRRAERTAIVRRKHFGPLRIQSPFYPEGDVCHVYILHPPGGVVGGDCLDIDLSVDAGAHALVTTPASGKFYRSNGSMAFQQQRLAVASDAVLEWLPQDTILFSDSYVNISTRVDLAHNARFIGWDMLCLGRPASGESYDGGFCRQALELWRDGKPLFIERSRYESQASLLNEAWGLQSYNVVATMVATHATPETIDLARSIGLDAEKGDLACTLIGDVLVCRLLAHQGETARQIFSQVWQAIRPQLLGREASPPRIWNT